MAIIKIKRGNKANLPSTANAGEPLLAIDTGELFYGDNSGNTQPVKVHKNNLFGLSAEGFYPDADKTKLAGVTSGATKTEASGTNGKIKINGTDTTVYTHPSTHPATMITSSVNGISGSDVDTILENLKAYADAMKQGLDIKDSVKAATTGNISLSGLQTIDGISISSGDRVLVKNQTDTKANGIYTASSGSWSRAVDADASADVTSGMFVFVESGSANASSGWVLATTGSITLGTTGLTFVQFSGAGQITAGFGINKSGNTLSVDDTDLHSKLWYRLYDTLGNHIDAVDWSGILSFSGDGNIRAEIDTQSFTMQWFLDQCDGGTF